MNRKAIRPRPLPFGLGVVVCSAFHSVKIWLEMATFKERLKALASWAWKREGLSFKERFENDYNYTLNSGKQVIPPPKSIY